MSLFVFVAALMVFAHLAAAWQRPRPAVIVSGLLWLAYAVWEYLILDGTLCDADCNIRVDLVVLLPILGLATWLAHRSYSGRSRISRVTSAALGVLALLVFGLIAWSFGFGVVAGITVALGLVVIAVLMFRAKDSGRA